jgi:hypothetical protein
MCIFTNITNIEVWTIAGTLGVFATLAYLIITDRLRSQKTKQENLYNWFKSLHFDVNTGQPMAIAVGRERVPFDWIEARPEYQNMTKKNKKLLRKLYGLK